MKRIVLALMSMGLFSHVAHADIYPTTVKNLDLASYAGTWYEIASSKPFFQKSCVCVSANYAPLEDGSMKVENSCRFADVTAEPFVTVGNAVQSEEPGKLTVSLGDLEPTVPNYWVVELADDYSHAVVTTALRWPVWVLSRSPEMSEDTLSGIYSRLEADGYVVDLMRSTVQQGCWE